MSKDLNEMTTSELGQLFPINILEYNPEWKNLFVKEKDNILVTFGSIDLKRVEHIGSTSIPGLCAKPTIDILIEISDNININTLINRLQIIQYQFIPGPESPPPHAMFAKGYSEKGITGQTFHIHPRYSGNCDEIIFRDHLIMHPETAQQYGVLKKRLSVEFKHDREKYTDGKTDFIRQILSIARNKS